MFKISNRFFANNSVQNRRVAEKKLKFSLHSIFVCIIMTMVVDWQFQR